ncbi:MAG: hypothetical protein HYV42_01870 [Candidatus Magasanikbacteria bacterium]|nr:hypothetical protein [Candidatus Magasanikbacteria bacterium]
MFEERAGWQSLQRSKRLVVGRWLPLLWRLAVPALVFSALTVLFDLLLAAWIPAFTDSEVWGKLLLNSVAALGGALFLIPLTLTAQIILYRAAAATLPATTEEDAS